MRIMGQSPSHTTLEVALLTKPNYAILSEEVIARKMTLLDVVNSIADVIEVIICMCMCICTSMNCIYSIHTVIELIVLINKLIVAHE